MRRIAREHQTTILFKGKVDKSLERAMKAAQSKAAKTAQKIGTGFKKAMKTAALATAAGAVAMTTAFAGFGADAVKSAATFQTEMQTVSTLLDGTAEQVKGRTSELSEAVLDLSNSTGITTDELSAGLYDVISAVGDSEDSMKILEIAAKAAAAGQAETSESISLLTGATKAYGDTSEEAFNKVSDLTFQTVKLGQTTERELAASMTGVTGIASNLGITQEELFGAYATLTGVTGNAAEVTTQLKGVFKGLMVPTEDMQKALEKAGYSTGKEAVEAEGLIGILDTLMGTVDGDKLAMSGLFSEINAKSAILTMCGEQAENLAKKTEAMNNAVGATEEAYSRQTDTLEHSINKIKNLWANLKTSVGTALLPTVQKIAEKLFPKIADAMETIAPLLIDAYTALEPTFDALGEAAANAIPVIVDAIREIMPQVSEMMPVTTEAITEMLSVIGELAPELAPLVSTLVTEILPAVIDTAKEIWEDIQPGLEEIKPLAEDFGEILSYIATEILPPLGDLFGDALNDVLEIVGTVGQWEGLAPAIIAVGSAFTSWKIVSTATKTVSSLNRIRNGIKKTVENMGGLTKIAEGVKGVFTGAFGGIKTAISFLMSPIGLVVVAIGLLIAAGVVLYKNWEDVKAMFLDIAEQIKGYFSQKIAEAAAGWHVLMDAISQTVWWQNLMVIVGTVKDVFGEFIEFIQNVFAGNWEAAWQNIVNIFESIFNGIKGVAQNIVNGVIDIINGFIGGINNVSGKVKGPQIPQIPHVQWLAKGATVTSPTLAVIGEGTDAETVVPHNNKPRSRDLLRQAAEGVYGKQAGRSSGSGTKIVYAPTIYAKDAKGVKEVLDEDYKRFKAFVERMKLEDNREVFA